MVSFSAELSDTHSETSDRYEDSMSQNNEQNTLMPDVANPPITVERIRPKARMPKPESYDDTDRTLFPQFLALLTAKLTFDHNVWDSEAERVWYAFGCLTGKASTRILPWITTYCEDVNEFTAKKLFEHLRTSFEDKATKAKAISKLSYMKQGQREFGEHLSEFEQTLLEAGVSGYDDSVKISWLRNSLSMDLRKGSVTVDDDNGYNDYCQKLRKIAHRMEENEKLSSRIRGGGNSWFNPGNFANARGQRQSNTVVDKGDPMDIDSGNRTTYNIRVAKWVEKSVLDNRRKAGECMRCGGGDHLIRNCPFAPPRRPNTKVNSVSKPLLESDDEDSNQEGKE